MDTFLFLEERLKLILSPDADLDANSTPLMWLQLLVLKDRADERALQCWLAWEVRGVARRATAAML